MKKMIALFLALALVLSLSAAVAEQRQFMLAIATDAEGNVTDVQTHPEQFTVLVLGIDDEAMTCAFGTQDNTVEGTLEIVETNQEEGYVTLHATLANGTEIEMDYVAADETVYIYDEETDLLYGLVDMEVLMADAA